MEVRNQDEQGALLGYPGQSEGLELKFWSGPSRPDPYRTSNSDGYWKIGITLPDVGLAVEKLRAQGVRVSDPGQFRDIGYLCHLKDPDGLSLELLQHHFESNFQTPKPGGGPLGGTAKIGQITLRISNPEESLAYYQKLGMKLLSVQPVEPYRFTLYFLAFTEEIPPEPNLESVNNREWLWQRPYTTLELQHRWKQSCSPAGGQDLGFRELVFQSGPSTTDPDGHRLAGLQP